MTATCLMYSKKLNTDVIWTGKLRNFSSKFQYLFNDKQYDIITYS